MNRFPPLFLGAVALVLAAEWWRERRARIRELRRRRQAVLDLEAHRRRQDLLSELTADFFYVLRVDEGHALPPEWVSESFERVTGWTLPVLLHEGGWQGLVHPEDRELLERHRDRLLAGQESLIEYRVLHQDGRPIWLRDRGRPEQDPETGRVSRVFGTARDVTRTKEAEAELQRTLAELEARVAARTAELEQSRRTLRTLFANLPGMAYRCRQAPGWPMDLVSEGSLDLTGHRPEAFVSGAVEYESCIHPGDRERVWDEVEAAVAAGRPFRLEYRIRDAAGHEKWVWEQGREVREGGKRFLEGFIIDITPRKEAEAALAAAERRLREAITGAPLVLWTTDRDGHFTLAEGRGLEALDLRPGAVVGRKVAAVYAQAPDIVTAHDRALAGETVEFQVEVAGLTWEARVSPLHEPDGTICGTIGVALDVTRRRELEEELLQSKKMEAIGSLAGGIAHDFNNLLTAINGCCELALQGLEADSSVRPEVEQILRAGRRAADLTGQLLAFSRRQVLAPRLLDLNELVRGMEPMLRRVLPENVLLEADLAIGIGAVLADPAQVEMVVMNLVVNARDSMPDGGTIHLATGGLRLEAAAGRRPADLDPGDYVVLEVQDEGHGMDEDTRSRIFEPFFTTKGGSKGTGLGLATVYGVVRQSGGTIQVESSPGVGSVFRVLLPARAGAGEAPWAVPVLAARTGAGETILLVEDEPVVRRLTRRILERAGYRVHEAGNAEDALAFFQDQQPHLDLLLTDVVMPGRNGRQLAEDLQAANPELKVLYMSGYADDTVLRHGIRESETPFLAKPFTSAELLARVAEALGEVGTEPPPSSSLRAEAGH